jgi:hypothetical protein
MFTTIVRFVLTFILTFHLRRAKIRNVNLEKVNCFKTRISIIAPKMGFVISFKQTQSRKSILFHGAKKWTLLTHNIDIRSRNMEIKKILQHRKTKFKIM